MERSWASPASTELSDHPSSPKTASSHLIMFGNELIKSPSDSYPRSETKPLRAQDEMKWNKVDFLHASYAEVAVSQARGSVLLKKDMLLQTHIGSVGSEYLPRKRSYPSISAVFFSFSSCHSSRQRNNRSIWGAYRTLELGRTSWNRTQKQYVIQFIFICVFMLLFFRGSHPLLKLPENPLCNQSLCWLE